jgi:hypothetical protein
LIRNNGFSNIAELFNDESRRLPEEDRLTLVQGVLGAYPMAFFEVEEKNLYEFVKHLSLVRDETSYRALKTRYGVNRNDPSFWEFSDWLHEYIEQNEGIDAGLLDYNRLEG